MVIIDIIRKFFDWIWRNFTIGWAIGLLWPFFTFFYLGFTEVNFSTTPFGIMRYHLFTIPLSVPDYLMDLIVWDFLYGYESLWPIGYVITLFLWFLAPFMLGVFICGMSVSLIRDKRKQHKIIGLAISVVILSSLVLDFSSYISCKNKDGISHIWSIWGRDCNPAANDVGKTCNDYEQCMYECVATDNDPNPTSGKCSKYPGNHCVLKKGEVQCYLIS